MRPPYHYGEYKWDNYLLDIQQQTREASETAQQAAADQLNELRAQTGELRSIHGTLEEMRAEFEWGFTLVVDRLDTQIEQLSTIVAKLDAIDRTLRTPLLTQTRELFQMGQEHLRKGLMDKALEAYLKAEQKNEVDFPLQLQIGKLFLYGRDEDDDVVDLVKAEKHLLLAARYADAEKGTIAQWNEYCGQAYFHAAVAAYLIGEQEQAAGRSASMRECLDRALRYLGKAANLWPRFADIVYTQAKCHALLGQAPDAMKKLEILSDRDRRYFAKASQDGDFEKLRAEVEELSRRATISPGPLAQAVQAKLDEVAEAVPWAKRSAPPWKEDVAAIETIERELSKARESLPTLDVDIEGLNERLSQTRTELNEIAQRSFKNNIDASQQAIASCELRKRVCENSIEQLERTMRSTSGQGMGCGFAVLFFVGGAVLASALGLGEKPVVALSMLGMAIVGAIIGSTLSRHNQNRPDSLKVEEHSRGIDECISALPLLKEQAEKWKKEVASFAAWRAEHKSSEPPSSRPDHRESP